MIIMSLTALIVPSNWRFSVKQVSLVNSLNHNLPIRLPQRSSLHLQSLKIIALSRFRFLFRPFRFKSLRAEALGRFSSMLGRVSPIRQLLKLRRLPTRSFLCLSLKVATLGLFRIRSLVRQLCSRL